MQEGLGRRSSLLLLAGLVLGALLIDAMRDHAATRQAPDFTLVSTGFEGGVHGEPVTFSLSEYRNKTVVLDFMAVLCTACRQVTQETLRPLWQDYGARDDFAIISIDAWADAGDFPGFGENANDVRALQASEDAPWRHALDDQHVWRAYDAASLPKIVVVDGLGRIVFSQGGTPDPDDVRAAVDASLEGRAQPVAVLRLGWVGLAFVAGLAAFVAPCAVGLLPAYLALLLNDKRRGPVRGGLEAAGGMLALYAALCALLLAAAAAGFGEELRAALPWLGPGLALALVLFGALALLGVQWIRIDSSRFQRYGLLGFGAAYAMAGFACTGPLLLPILFAAFAESVAVGLAVMAAYAVAITGLAVAAAALVASGRGLAVARWARGGTWLQRVTGVLMVAAGLFLLWNDRVRLL